MSSHTITLPDDRCVWRLVKTLLKGMPECVVLEEMNH